VERSNGGEEKSGILECWNNGEKKSGMMEWWNDGTVE
jgi:hypothetical protein